MATDHVIDAHVHVASTDETAYPRTLTPAGSDWWRTRCGVDELTAELDAAGVDRAVVVQAVGVYGYDCTYAADAVAASDGRLALVGAIDMAGTDAVADLRALVAATPLTGVRLFGVSAAGAGWLTNGVGAAVWEVAGDNGLVVVPTIFPDGLPGLRSVIEAHPDVTVALDHCAFPDFGGEDAMADLAAMADLPALHLKVTSHNLDHDADPATFVDTLAAAFGANRLCWGSDHPQHQTKTYRQMLDLALDASRHLTADERTAFLGGNAAALWW